MRLSLPDTDPVSNPMSKGIVKFGINDSIMGDLKQEEESSYYNETDSEFEEEVKNAGIQMSKDDLAYRSLNRLGLSPTMSTSNHLSKGMHKVDPAMIHMIH